MINPNNLYIDPSVMSYALQFVVAGVVTVGAIVGIVVRKTKKKIKKTLNIEEKKEIAVRLLNQSELSNEKIAEYVGLDIEVVNTLAKEQKEII